MVRKSSKSKNEKSKHDIFDDPSNLYEKVSKIHSLISNNNLGENMHFS